MRSHFPLVAVALAAAGLAVPTTVAGPARAAETQPCRVSYTQDVDHEITEGAAFDPSVLVVPGAGTVADVNVKVEIVHPNDGEVALSLWHAGAGPVTLVDGVGGAGDNFTGTVFDDEASTAITDGTAPFTGRFEPMQALSAYDGTEASGEWQLLAKDTSLGPGTLTSWTLVLTYAACDLDDDGVDDYSDKCLGLAGPEPSGCPVIEGDLTLRWGSGQWSGHLDAPRAACQRDRVVRVMKVAPAGDRKIGSDTTNDAGAWTVPAPRPNGKYYATTPRVLLPDVGICASVTSPTRRY